MGTFAWFYRADGAKFPENKKTEFAERIEKLFYEGGMMNLKKIELLDKKLYILQKARMDDEGMRFHFNYFEDDFWEYAGFNKQRCEVWSNKIGWNRFNLAILASYVLQELYTDGTTAVFEDNEPIFSWAPVGWINYLFEEHFHFKNLDPWNAFEALSDRWPEDAHYYYEGSRGYAFIGGCEIYAVLHGTAAAKIEFESWEKGSIEAFVWGRMKKAGEHLEMLCKESNSKVYDSEQLLSELIELIREYYTTHLSMEAFIASVPLKYRDFIENFCYCDAPAFIVKILSEHFEHDFWNLWSQISDVAKRKFAELYGRTGAYVLPISTLDYFKMNADDMILYWTESSTYDFTDELYRWFDKLKEAFDDYMASGYRCENPLRFVANLMEEAHLKYYLVLAISDFFEETLENLSKVEYQVLWKLFDDMVHNPELLKAGEVIFAQEENKVIEPRRLEYNWTVTHPDKRQNKGRVTLKRYMALVANRNLREKVFGF